MRNITVLITANSAPAKPPPPGIFETFICGFGAPSLIPHFPTLGYHLWRTMVRREDPAGGVFHTTGKSVSPAEAGEAVE